MPRRRYLYLERDLTQLTRNPPLSQVILQLVQGDFFDGLRRCDVTVWYGQELIELRGSAVAPCRACNKRPCIVVPRAAFLISLTQHQHHCRGFLIASPAPPLLHAPRRLYSAFVVPPFPHPQRPAPSLGAHVRSGARTRAFICFRRPSSSFRNSSRLRSSFLICYHGLRCSFAQVLLLSSGPPWRLREL